MAGDERSTTRLWGKTEIAPGNAPRRMGPYELGGRLASGGRAEVFLAVDPQGRELAVKILSQALAADEQARLRFEREWKTLAELDHPSIVRCVGHGVDAEARAPYIAFELVLGGSLADLLDARAQGRCTVEETLYLLDSLAGALAAAHGRGVLHRDVSPTNVLFLPGGAVKLADFGLALADDVSFRLTGQDELLGSAQYVAPEVAASATWSEAADVYALGALAFRVLAGRALFGDEIDAAKVLKAQIGETPPALAELVPEVPQTLSRLVARLLSKKPQDRPKASELSTLLADIPPVVSPRKAPVTLARDIGRLALRRGHGAGEGRLSPGRSLHVYRIEAEIGRGGMGVVYRAHHAGLKRTVALKVLLAGALATDEARKRFLIEAQSVGALRHPNIVSVLDAGEADGKHYLTMEHIEGVPLSKHLRAKVDLRALLVLFTKLCDAVHHAHTRGVIHRDLKPDNVLVDAAGEPHILDFGIAKRIDSTTQDVTGEGSVLGTLRYMPPEQAGGRNHEVDVRSDVYALGSILYEIATRERTPFQGSMREILQQILLETPKPPSAFRPDLPWELDAICLKALEKDRDDRYQSALELKREMERYLEGRPIAAHRGTVAYRLRKFAVRNKKRVALYAAGALLSLLATAAFLRHEIERERERRAKVVGETRLGWTEFARKDFRKALQRFGEARALAEEDDRFALPEDVVATISSGALAPLPAGERTRLTGELLASWCALATQRIDEARAQESAQALVETGRKLLASGKLEEAQRAFVQALGFDGQSRAAQDGLGEAERLVGLEKAQADARAQLERDRAESKRLADRGRAALSGRRCDEAKAAFLQALGFDGKNQAATDGLAETTRTAEALQKEKDLASRFEEGRKELDGARRALKKCRDFARQGVERKKVQTAYFEALQAFDRALIVAPEGSAEAGAARGEKGVAARELARMVTEESNFGLAEYLLLIAGGAGNDDRADAAATRDPLLVVREANAVMIQRAFREPIEFEPSEAWFKPVRDDVLAPLGQRFRLIVEICSRIEDATPPRVYATGLKLSVEDREKNVTTATETIEFEGGPFARVVVANTSGRVMQTFSKAIGLRADAKDSDLAKKVAQVVRDHVDRLKK